MTIPKKVTKLYGGTFYGCGNLISVTFLGRINEIEKKNIFRYCKKLPSIDLPEGLTKIGIEIFSTCSSLEIITIRGNLRTIERYVFYQCKNVKIINYYGVTNP